METNWNQLIERYLQNELSEEGRNAFEQELLINPELREELEMHQLIQSAAKRATQRNMIQQTGKLYLRNLRIKQFAIGVVITAATTVGIVYWGQHKRAANRLQTQNTFTEENTEEKLSETVQINNQPDQTGGKSSLIQPTDWHRSETSDFHTNAYETLVKSAYNNSFEDKKSSSSIKTQLVSAKADSLPLPKPTELILGYSTNELKQETIESSIPSGTVGKSMLWMQKYDSVGKFNDLYCGYALVMDKAKFGFIDPDGKLFIPLIYDQIVVTTNIKSSKQKSKRLKKKILYIPKRSGKDVKDCEEGVIQKEEFNMKIGESVPNK